MSVQDAYRYMGTYRRTERECRLRLRFFTTQLFTGGVQLCVWKLDMQIVLEVYTPWKHVRDDLVLDESLLSFLRGRHRERSLVCRFEVVQRVVQQ